MSFPVATQEAQDETSLLEDYKAKHGIEWQILHDLASRVRFTAGPHVKQAMEYAEDHILAYLNYFNDLNAATSSLHQYLIAASVQQIIESVKDGPWKKAREEAEEKEGDSEEEKKRKEKIRNFLPTFDEIDDEYEMAPNGDNVSAKKRLETLIGLKQTLEAKARQLVEHLASDNFLEEFNNMPDLGGNVVPYYSPDDQLYLATFLGLHLSASTTGMEFLERSTAVDLATIEKPPGIPDSLFHPKYYMPVFHPKRNVQGFGFDGVLAPASLDYYDPVTDAYDVDRIAVLKSLGDGFMGAYIHHRSYVLSGLLRRAKLDQAIAREAINEILHETLITLDLRDPANAPMHYLAAWDDIMDDAKETETRIRAASPYVAASVVSVLAMVGFLRAVRKLEEDPEDKKIRNYVEGMKETVALVAVLSGAATQVSQRLGKEAAKEVFDYVSSRLSVVAAAIDVGVSMFDLAESMTKNPDQIAPNALKVTGAAVGLGAGLYTVLGGGALLGPAGIVVSLGVLLVSLGGQFLAILLADGYIESYLNKCRYGLDGFASSLDPKDFEYQFNDLAVQFSAYARIMLGIGVSIHGSEHEVSGGITQTLLKATLQTKHPLARGTHLELFQATPANGERTIGFHTHTILGPPDDASPPRGGRLERIIRPFSDPSLLYEIREVWRLVEGMDNVLDNYVCEEVRWSLQSDGAFLGKHLGYRITLRDEAAQVFQATLLSSATGIPMHQIPLSKPLVVTAVSVVKPSPTFPKKT